MPPDEKSQNEGPQDSVPGITDLLWRDTRPLGLVFQAVMALVAIVVPLFGPLIAIVVAVVSWRRRGAQALLVFGVLMAGIHCAVCLPGYFGAKRKVKEAQVKSNLHMVQIALHQYASDHDALFPLSIETLLETEHLHQMPKNPFTEQPTREIPFGLRPFEGEFTYIPSTVGEDVVGWYLFGYGHADRRGLDVDADGIDDHVILVLTGKLDNGTPLPPLEELLR